MSQIIRQREVTEVEHKVDEHKSNVDNTTHHTTVDTHDKKHDAKTGKTGVLGKIAEVFSTGWMHTDVTGHPYDTRGMYGPTGVKFTPAPGEVLADGTKVKQLDDHSAPTMGVAGAAPVGYTPSGIDQYTTHGSTHNLATGAALPLAAGAAATTHHSKPIVSSTPVMATSTTHQSKYIPAGANGFFAREAFRNDLSKFGSRNRLSAVQKLDKSLHTRFTTNLRQWYMAERTEMQQSRQSSMVKEVERTNEPLQTVAQGEIRVVELPRTMVTSTFETNNAPAGGWSQHATQHAGLHVIETHKAPIIDNHAKIVESQQRETIVSGPTIVATSAQAIAAPMHTMSSTSSSTHHHVADNLSSRMAATTIGSHHHHDNKNILSSSNTMATGGQTILAKEQAFEPQLSGRSLAGDNVVVGQTPLGPAGAPYKSGVDSKYVDLNATSTGEMHKDVTGFPYDTRGIVGPKGINADLAQAEKNMASSTKIHKSS